MENKDTAEALAMKAALESLRCPEPHNTGFGCCRCTSNESVALIEAALAAAREERGREHERANLLASERNRFQVDLMAAASREAALKDKLSGEQEEHMETSTALYALQAQVEKLRDALSSIASADPDAPEVESWKWLARKLMTDAAAAIASTAPAEESPKELVPDPGYCGLLSKPLVIALQGMERALRTLSAAHRAALDAEAAEPQPEPTACHYDAEGICDVHGVGPCTVTHTDPPAASPGLITEHEYMECPSGYERGHCHFNFPSKLYCYQPESRHAKRGEGR